MYKRREYIIITWLFVIKNLKNYVFGQRRLRDNVRATNKNIIQNYKWKKKEDLEKGNNDFSWVELSWGWVEVEKI